MNILVPILIDLFIIAFVALFVWLQAKRGFVRTLVEFVGCVAAFVVAFSIAAIVSDAVYTNIIKPNTTQTINEIVEQSAGNGVDTIINNVFDELPDFIVSIGESNGVNRNTLSKNIDNVLKNNANTIGTVISDQLIKPIATSAMSLIIAVLLSGILMIFVRILAKRVNSFFDLPLLNTANTVLGGVFGLLKGLVLVFAIVVIISFLMKIFGNSFPIFTNETILKTHLFKVLYELNPFI